MKTGWEFRIFMKLYGRIPIWSCSVSVLHYFIFVVNVVLKVVLPSVFWWTELSPHSTFTTSSTQSWEHQIFWLTGTLWTSSVRMNDLTDKWLRLCVWFCLCVCLKETEETETEQSTDYECNVSVSVCECESRREREKIWGCVLLTSANPDPVCLRDSTATGRSAHTSVWPWF